MIQRLSATLVGCLAVVTLAACNPSDDRPGLWLSGQDATTAPTNWAFTDAHQEISVEVASPYFLRHSVTVWCAQVDGVLYLGAGAPTEKNWPGWVDDNPNVRLLVGDSIYPGILTDVSAPGEIAKLEQAYVDKYPIESMDVPGGIRYWRVSTPAALE